MSDKVVTQDSGDKLAKDSKHNLGGPGPDQNATTSSSSNAQPEAEHGQDQAKKVGKEQYQDLKDSKQK
ncbi:hypothetical protein SCAR479_07467 [Seiridium cardinale]|uniref:Uncharacterized protein n=1 Tax=Seiridium cardinale TaxID=138064 RepID=A0ABR2XQL1_9PEZI